MVSYLVVLSEMFVTEIFSTFLTCKFFLDVHSAQARPQLIFSLKFRLSKKEHFPPRDPFSLSEASLIPVPNSLSHSIPIWAWIQIFLEAWWTQIFLEAWLMQIFLDPWVRPSLDCQTIRETDALSSGGGSQASTSSGTRKETRGGKTWNAGNVCQCIAMYNKYKAM